MKINVLETPEQLGQVAALHAARFLNERIRENGKARIILSTGASQFEFFKAFVKTDVDWNKVEMFHLDEYVHLPESHPASFRTYLKNRFLAEVNIKKAHFVNGEGDFAENIRQLNAEIAKERIDLAMIGIGENAHIAFNDPPADFATKQPYMIVELDEACKRQQVGEGWFDSVADVPKQAITMSVHQIMQSDCIISCVPHKVKAGAVRATLEQEVTPAVPATILKTHPNWSLYLDRASASEIQGRFQNG
ncbi:glucosamine-6-phosphate deaminase [Gordoniibacillus kamchatkensis]|uniref:Glucosamine-6-phosphate deaminase n=1 Tax=Gordoniibacillus kamchatkensis TaxID=1590651 RepID=A0ABR5AAV1_9BACL|nr:glucosamine-6-phosphate deaminase [Paenibacillus sp. VKM B-2647]KIL38189.1 glucosamine-6-phosphate deaminase [Paenibacillus sp. VKM B-2647]